MLKAIKRRNVVAAVAAAKELPQLSPLDALELTVLIARKESQPLPVGGGAAHSQDAGWLLRSIS